jgi:VWFA-related protein
MVTYLFFDSARTLAHKLRGAALLALFSGALWPAASQAPAPQTTPPAAVRVTTRLVQVDVVVTDKQGHPVTDLKESDFTLLENGKPQKIATFSLEQPLEKTGAREAPPAPLPPNVYSNRPEYAAPAGPMTMLLMDALNTPQGDQMYARKKMLEYLASQLPPNQGTAILGLGTNLRLLQDFTTDPRLLRAAVQKYNGGKSPLLTEPGEKYDIPQASQPGMAGAMARTLQEFQDEQIRAQTDIRVQTTLAALRAIARAATGYSGRKILVWVSAAFPISLGATDFIPGSRFVAGLGQSRYYQLEVKRTAALLADAQVAIYPVDARGLVGLPFADASLGRVDNVRINELNNETIDSHFTMMQLAEDTGGRAFFNRNDIDRAVAAATADGATFYQLGFYPAQSAWDGKFRKLSVKILRPGLEARHRRGYFASDPLKWHENNTEPDLDLANALRSPIPATQVKFAARVVSHKVGQESVVDIQFAVYTDAVTFEQEQLANSPEIRHRAILNFAAMGAAADGKIAFEESKALETHFRELTYARMHVEGIPFHMQIKAAPGHYQLHLGVRDDRTGWVGTLIAPLEVE